jgi:type IV secretory pathway VirB2 component (pilin)
MNAADAKVWYLGTNGKRVGPLSALELKQLGEAGRVRPGMFVWKEGLANWSPVESVKGLRVVAAAAAPAEPLPAVTRPAVQYLQKSHFGPLAVFLAVTAGVAVGGFLAIEGAKRYDAYRVRSAVTKVAKEMDAQFKKDAADFAASMDAVSEAMRFLGGR